MQNVFFHNYGSDTWHLPPHPFIGINKAIAAGVPRPLSAYTTRLKDLGRRMSVSITN